MCVIVWISAIALLVLVEVTVYCQAQLQFWDEVWVLSARALHPVTSVLTVIGCELQNCNSGCVWSGWLSLMFLGTFAKL
jgi:hypothetical protein